LSWDFLTCANTVYERTLSMEGSLPADDSPRLAVIRKMEAENISPKIIQTFLYYYDQLAAGNTCLIHDREIEPVKPGDILKAEELASYEPAGLAASNQFVRIVLNGGLGTSMGLLGPKSLLKVKNGHSFLEIILTQTISQKSSLCFMNSFSTHQDTLFELQRIGSSVEPMIFLQHKFPKILQSNLFPADCSDAPHLEWNPPGHGDIYIALHTSGILKQLLDQGIRFALISNSDNLGASLDMSLLGYFAEENRPFMMEVARRLPSDAKGGHLARYRSGQLVLRESAQCPPEQISMFRNIDQYHYFNTNNIWINLMHLQELIDKEGMIKLPMILNPKAFDPRDEGSPPVFQLETAMGAAISLFDGATAVCVPRTRFFPVKTCNDLLALRSDRFILLKNGYLMPNPLAQTDTIQVELDPAFYKNIDDFNKRFSHGIPSLLECEALTVVGDVYFEPNVTIKGTVAITNSRNTAAVIAEGSVIKEDLLF
jgi:UTP--glucose-1-phosphate uridylyltransferase